MRFVAADYMTVAGGPYDVIVSDTVLHAIPVSTEALFGKIARELRPGGLLVYTMPAASRSNHALAAVRRVLRLVRGRGTDALLLAHCQPEVGAFFNFELIDEDRLAGWQSGVLWRDGTRKPSYDHFRQAVELVKSGTVDCRTVPGAGGPMPERPPDAATGSPG